MARSFDPAEWQSFFLAMIGAAAALTGLLFVAVSINLDHILRGGPTLTARAFETLSMLLLVLLTGGLALVPQSTRLLGAEIVVLALSFLALTVPKQLRDRRARPEDPMLWTVSRMTTTAVGALPAVLGGISLLVHWGGGFYWLVPAALLGIAGAVFGAWVLLVEIVR
jgi:hypothetical protein